ncbi:MAG TPA: tetratricopeptide repeat protein, partial [Candidatus Hydrogenedentes bacterium]|nr:tetratricopeptide repeat protein [Candidatus Hydrogenedentota bacterium]
AAAKVGGDDPKSDAARALLGQALFELKDYARSAQVLEELLTGKWIDADNVALMYALGVAWESAGHLEKAREAYRKVGMFNPMYKDIAERLKRSDKPE